MNVDEILDFAGATVIKYVYGDVVEVPQKINRFLGGRMWQS